jgi:hypothetical protein
MNDDLRDRLDAVEDAVDETDTMPMTFEIEWVDPDGDHDRPDPDGDTFVVDFTGEP